MLNPLGQIELSKTVILKPYTPPIPKQYELMTDEEITNGAGGTLLVDCESYENYFLIAFKNITTQKYIIFEFPGDFNPFKLSWIMHAYRTVGFNTIKFDLPLIWYSYLNQNAKVLKEITNKIIFQNTFPKQLELDYKYKIHRTNHIDLIEVCPLKGSLKLYGSRLHARRIQDLPYDVNEPITNEQIPVVIDYCINDLDTTEVLLNNLTEQIKLREELSKEYKQDLMSKSDAQIAEAVISSELKRLTGSWPKKPKIESTNSFSYKLPSFIYFETPGLQKVAEIICNAKYELLDNGKLIIPKEIENLKIAIGNGIYRLGSGGLHSSEKNIAVKSNDEYKIYDRDVASYYPAIVLNCGLYPEHLGEAFLTVYRTLVNRRIDAKKAKNIAVSECLKICINGTFGKTGSPYSVLYAPEMMIQITITGQLALLMLIEQLELNEITVASANTDGILIYCPQYREQIYRNIIVYWEALTKFVTEETEYEAVYSRDVNAYIAVKKDGSVKGKNVYYDPWRGKSARDNYWKFQKNPTTQICVEAIERLIVSKVPVDKTILECQDITKFIAVKNVTGGAHKEGNYLGKTIRWYYALNIVGTINYIKNDHKVPDTEGAKPCMDLPEQFPNDIDYQYYIKKTNEMLEDMGYYQKQGQLKFF